MASTTSSSNGCHLGRNRTHRGLARGARREKGDQRIQTCQSQANGRKRNARAFARSHARPPPWVGSVVSRVYMDEFRHAMSPSCVAHTRKFVVLPTRAGLFCATTSQKIKSRSKEEGRLIGKCSTKQGTIVFLSSPDAMGTISSHPNRISLRVSAPLKPRRCAPAAIPMKHTSRFTITRTRFPTIGCSNLPPSNVTSKPIDVGTCKCPRGSRHGSLPRMDPCFLVHLARP